MGFFDRFFGRKPAPPELGPGPSPAAPTGPDDEDWLISRLLAADAGEADAAAQLGGEEADRRFAALIAAGRTRLAAELMVRAARVISGDADALRARAAELFWDRGDLEAIPLAEALTESPPHAARAHFLLGEHWRAQADRRRALHHFEAALAIDVDYPNARARVEALRDALGRPAAAAAGETMLGPGVEVAGARYHLMRELGRGATGVVYLARDGELRREVGQLVVKTTAAVTGKILSADDQRRLAEETVRQLT